MCLVTWNAFHGGKQPSESGKQMYGPMADGFGGRMLPGETLGPARRDNGNAHGGAQDHALGTARDSGLGTARDSGQARRKGRGWRGAAWSCLRRAWSGSASPPPRPRPLDPASGQPGPAPLHCRRGGPLDPAAGEPGPVSLPGESVTPSWSLRRQGRPGYQPRQRRRPGSPIRRGCSWPRPRPPPSAASAPGRC